MKRREVIAVRLLREIGGGRSGLRQGRYYLLLEDEGTERGDNTRHFDVGFRLGMEVDRGPGRHIHDSRWAAEVEAAGESSNTALNNVG